MTDTFEFTLNNPLTEEQWDMITDVDFDRTDRITFHTKHGKEVEFTKLIRCKDCRYYEVYERKYDGSADKRFKPSICTRAYEYAVTKAPNWFCADAEPKEEYEKKKTKEVISPDLRRRALTQEVNETQTRLKNAISRGYDSKTIDLLRKHYNSAKKELEAFLDETDNNVR